MSWKISIKTSSGSKLYKISETGNKYYCMKYGGGPFGGWDDIGSARSFEDAISLIKSYAISKYGSIYSVHID